MAPPSNYKMQRAQRQTKIVRALGHRLLSLSADFVMGHHSPARQRQQAQKLVNTLISLGPTFIKIGQTISTRVDLLPQPYLEALAQLQDRVPPFATATAVAIVEAELGKPLAKIFRAFEPRPIAAASLGQVHRAQLLDGTMVVVKVQRPGLEELFRLDFAILHSIVRFCEQRFPWTSTYGLTAIYEDFFNLLLQEIDYRQEGQNADRFHHNFRHQRQIVSPHIYWRYTTSKVLTMSYLPGIKIDRREQLLAEGFDPRRINQIGICCYLQQLMVDGFFQGDPHPGNMAITPTGQLVVYDFGMMTELPGDIRERAIDTFLAITRRDGAGVIFNLEALGLLGEVEDKQPVQQVINFLLDRFTERPVDLAEFAEIRSEVAALYAQNPFRLPREMTAILKALSTLDGIARTLDNQYNLMQAARPFIQRLALLERRTIVRQVGRYLGQSVGQYLGPRRRDSLTGTRPQPLSDAPAATVSAPTNSNIAPQGSRLLVRLRLLARGVITLTGGVALGTIDWLLAAWVALPWFYGLLGVGVAGIFVGLACLGQLAWLEKRDPLLRAWNSSDPRPKS